MQTLTYNNLPAIGSHYKNLEKSTDGPLAAMKEKIHKLEAEVSASEKTLEVFDVLPTLKQSERLEQFKTGCPRYFDKVKEDVEKKLSRINRICDISLGLVGALGFSVLAFGPFEGPWNYKAALATLLTFPGVVLAASYLLKNKILDPHFKPGMQQKRITKNTDKWHQEEKIRHKNLQQELKELKKTYFQEARIVLARRAEANEALIGSTIIEQEEFVDIDGCRLDVQV